MKNEIINIMSNELNISPEDVIKAKSFKFDLNVDSLDIFQVTLAIQQKYGVSINEPYDTVDQLVKLVTSNEE